MKHTSKIFVLSISLLGVLAFGLLLPTSTVQAASGVESSAAQALQDNTVLENMLVREKLALSNQQERLTLSHNVADETQIYINNQKSAGKDTSSLESALNEFNQSISQAEVANNTAASVLAAPAGFDASGQVVDVVTARQTIRSAGQSLQQAHVTLTQATLELRLVIQTYRGE